MRNLFKYFIDRPLVVKLMLILIVLIGLAFSTVIKREGLPKVDMREVHITTIYPGASPEDVELNVTIPVEDALKGVAGIKEMKSSSMENLSRIELKLDPDVTDLEAVKRDIRRAVDTVDDLPKEIKDRPRIWELKVQNFAVIEVAFSSDTLKERDLIDRARAFKKRLERLDRVSRVDDIGIRDREIQIKVNLDRLNANFLSFSDIIQAIQSQNINLAGGNLESYVDEKGIITVSRFETLADVENIILRSNFEGMRIRLKDVARVVDTFERRTSYIRYNGSEGVSLQVVKKENADIIRTIEDVKALVGVYRKSPVGKDVQIHFLNDMSFETRSRLSIVLNNAVIGLILVVVILFVFLNRKIAFWTAMGLPVSIFMSIGAMHIMGITINTISLSGIIIVLGMLVDDAIIIAENIFRYRRSGMSWKDAALEGVHEVAGPVIATVLTTIIAFIPILFMSGVVGDFAQDIPVVISLVLLASLFEGFFILPQHLSHVPQGKREKAASEEESRIARRFFGFLERVYRPLLRFSLRRRFLVLLFFLILLSGSFLFMATSMKFMMFDPSQATIFWIDAQTRRGSSLEKTSNDIRQIEEYIRMYMKGSVPGMIDRTTFEVYICDALSNEKDSVFLKKWYIPGRDGFYRLRPGADRKTVRRLERILLASGVKKNVVESFKSQIGLTIWGASEDPNFFNIIVYMTPANTRKMRASDLIALIRQRMRGMKVVQKSTFVIDDGGPPMGRELEVKITGHDDVNRLRALRYLESLFSLPASIPEGVFGSRVVSRLKERPADLKLVLAAYSKDKNVRILKKDLDAVLAAGQFRTRVLGVVKSEEERSILKRGFRLRVPETIPEITFRTRILNRIRDPKEAALLRRSYRFDGEKKIYRFDVKRAEGDTARIFALLNRNGFPVKRRHVLRSGLSSEEKDRVAHVLHEAGFLTGMEKKRLEDVLHSVGLMVKGIYDTDHDFEAGKDEMRVRLDYRKIARFGLQAIQVAQAIRTAYNGTVVTWQQTQKEKVEYRVLLDDVYRRGRWTLDRIQIGNREGRLIPIRNLLLISERKSIKRIHHWDRDRAITFMANIRSSVITPIEVFARLKALVPAMEKRFPGISVLVKGKAEESDKTFGSLMTALMVAVVAVYFLLVLLFNSFSQPWLVLAAIPFGMIGVIFAFGIHGLNMSLMAMLGVIGLSGVVVNDSLVMIDFINKSREREPAAPLDDVIMESAILRVRPIFLTTLTTCAGLFPTAYGMGGYDAQIAPMTMALAWGLVFATVLTLVLVPVLYRIEKDTGRRLAGWRGRFGAACRRTGEKLFRRT